MLGAASRARLPSAGEDQIPDFQKAVAIALADAAVRPAGHVLALIDIDFGTGAAGAGVAHGPEVVLLTHADDARVGKPGHVLPDLGGLVVLAEDRDPEFFLGQLQFFGHELPGPGNGLALEVVAEGKIAQHLEKGVVARGAAHVFQVVVLAGHAQAFLTGSRAGVGALFLAQKELFKLDHARVGEQKAGVIGRDQRPGRHDFVPMAQKKVQITAADFLGSQHTGSVAAAPGRNCDGRGKDYGRGMPPASNYSYSGVAGESNGAAPSSRSSALGVNSLGCMPRNSMTLASI